MGIREDDRLERSANMPHRAFARGNCLDSRLESELGRLCFRGLISRSQYEAGLRYANFVLIYLWSIGAPSPYGGEYQESGTQIVIGRDREPRAAPIISRLDPPLSEDISFQRKMNVAAARKVLKDAGRHCIRVVDRVAVYDEPLRDEELPHKVGDKELSHRGELCVLRAGLSALAGEPTPHLKLVHSV